MGIALSVTTLGLTFCSFADAQTAERQNGTQKTIARTLLISIAGMHTLDLAKFISSNPDSTLVAMPKRSKYG